MRDLIVPKDMPILRELKREYRILFKRHRKLKDPDPEIRAHSPKHKAFKLLLGKGYTPEETVEIWNKIK